MTTATTTTDRHVRLVVVLVALALVSCTAAPEPLPYGDVDVEGHRGAVVAASGLVRAELEGPWRPTADELRAFERSLRDHLARTEALPAELPARLGSYTRRYLGYTERGRRMLRVSMTCLSFALPEDVPHDRMIEISHGGACHCEAWFDADGGELVRFVVAGDA